MTSEALERVGRQLIGIYFVVQGALTAAGAIGVFGVVAPDGISRAALVAATLAQSVVALSAGAWLLKSQAAQSLPTSEDLTPAARHQGHVAIQLLGVFFFVGGVIALARVLAGLTVSQAWQWRLAELAGGAVGILAGAGLAWWPTRVQKILETRAGA